MTDKIIAYFAKRHLLMNFVFAAVFIGGIFAWHNTSKEEMPEITFDRIRIATRYPGASAEDVESLVTKPIEEAVRGLDGVYRVTSTSSVGSSNISVELEPNYPDKDETITEIRNTVLDVKLPEDILDDPNVRVFKTTKKAIIDIALINTDVHLLDVETRRELQRYTLALENKLLNLPEVNSVNRRGYLQEEIQIKVHPEKLSAYEIPFNAVMREIKNNHLRQPAGSIQTPQEPKVTLLSELDSVPELEDVVIQGGFEGRLIRLREVAEVRQGYEKNDSVIKINGHEGIMLNVVKNSSAGILEALDAVNRVVAHFKKDNLDETPLELILLDDESIDLRNRLSIISFNGILGFIFILITLFIFLNKRSGLWVAMGIPFTFCFTMICASLMGYTINDTTLAGVIIVMGMIVDDAIVVAENITRLVQNGVDQFKAVVDGTAYVLLPIIASIVTTCVAFIPLFFFSGHFGKFVAYIPLIIFLMLGASLVESVFILPGHMLLKAPWNRKGPASKESSPKETKERPPQGHWFDKIENNYGQFLSRLLPHKKFVFLFFFLLLGLSVLIVKTKMKFVMFPNEETRTVVLTGEADPGITRYETAKLVQPVEKIIGQLLGREVIGYRTEIARSRRGGAVEENRFRMIVEIVPKEKRRKSADQLIKGWEKELKGIQGFKELKFQKSRWGHGSGSPIEIVVQENNDSLRDQVVRRLVEKMKAYPALTNVEVEEPIRVPEYRISINREKVKRLSISPVDIASTFRASLEGTVLYDFSNGDEDVDVRFTIVDEAKDDIEKVLNLPVENKGDYLVPLRDIVTVEEVVSPNAISREEMKRTTLIVAGIRKGSRKTPLDIADYFEANVFSSIVAEYPSTILSFGGEVKDTRESKSDFTNAVMMSLALIYFVLSVLFNSLIKPLIIMLAIPFGVVGVILAFWLHGKVLFGFFAAVGALGLAGVVVNDSIIMLVKLDKEYDPEKSATTANSQIARIAQTRLRAILLTTLTTVAGVLPTTYGFAGYDSMLAEMMLALTWGLLFGTMITLVLIPCVYSFGKELSFKFSK